MNRSFLILCFAIFAVSWGWSQSALAEKRAVGTARPAGVAAPVEFRACNFNEGKTMADLDQVTAKFRDYANKNDFAYAAWTLVPQYHTGSDFDVGWLGAWPDGEAFGVSMERWMTTTTGRALAAEFAEVWDCNDHHELSMSFPINAADSTPQDGVMLVYECSLGDSKTLDQAYAAHLEWGTAKKGMGFLDNSWMFQPTIGVRELDYDYYHVVVFYRYSDLGAAFEAYANDGGMQKRAKIYGDTMDCGAPFIYDFLSVRARDER